ncbi:MAG: hypothetical protein ORN57_01755, partial [Alphaproteobacteria bacterium]|nr:hypothetical protein [Alphaproteobacteria bacterium]
MKKLLSAHGAGRFAADKKQPANNNNYHLRQIIKGFIAHKKRDRSGLGGQAGAPIIIDSPATSKVADKLIATSKVADKLIAPHEMARLALAPTLLLAIPLVTAEAQTFKLNQSAQTVKLTQTAQIDQVTPTPTKLQDNEYLSAER